MLLTLFGDEHKHTHTSRDTHTQSHGQIFAQNAGFQLSDVSVFDETTVAQVFKLSAEQGEKSTAQSA